MARKIRKNETILDFVDVSKNFATLEGTEYTCISLNKYEWIQLLNLIVIDYKGASNTVAINADGTSAKYNDMFLYYDGGDNMAQDYLDTFDHMRDTLNDHLHPLEDAEERPRNTTRRANAPRPTERYIPVPDQINWNTNAIQAAALTPTRG